MPSGNGRQEHTPYRRPDPFRRRPRRQAVEFANHRAHSARNISFTLKGECTMFFICYPKNREMTLDEMIVASELARL